MKINNLKINGFGKIKDKEINLYSGINIIYGENESGKSTFQKFISGMLYGISKNKNGKEISDFERYKPWQTEEFSGKIEYTLDNGENFEVYREFKKKNPIILNSKKEDISKTFKIDKSKGIDFFVEQTGIDEKTFYNTAITEQEGIKLSKSSQNSIIQKISNLVSSGNDNISFKKSLDKINKRQNEEVGTERTSQRPINIVNSKIDELVNKKGRLEIYKENMSQNFVQKEQLKLEEKDEKAKLQLLKEVKIKLDNNRLKSAEINFSKNLENNYTEQIEDLNKKLKHVNYSSNKSNSNQKCLIIFGLLLLVFLILMLISPYKLINLILLIPMLFTIYKKVQNDKKNKIKKDNINNSNAKILNEIDLLKQSREKQREEWLEKEEKLNEEVEKEKKEIANKYIKLLDLGFIETSLNKNYDEILQDIELKENNLNTIKFKLHTIEQTIIDINNRLDELAETEEELQDFESQKDELISLNNSYNIAKECLEKAYAQVKENISPRFMENLCNITSKISERKYTNVIFSDDEGLRVEIENGRYIPVSRLSVGTIDQMYIALRLSALDEISDETLPIILDEAFSYFDNERLTNILGYFFNNFKNSQIIIFTCSDREISILNRLNIEYNLINLEK